MTRRRRYHFHLPGVIYMFITVLLAVGAFNSQNNLLFWAFGFALAILLVSSIISTAMLAGITAEREPIHPATAGDPLIVRYRIHNRNRLMPAFALHVEELRPGRPRQVRFRLPPRPFLKANETGRDAPGWTRQLSPVRGFVAHVGPGQTVFCEAPARAIRRGMATLDLFRVQSTFPFGLVRKSIELPHKRTVIVRPKLDPPADPSIVAASHRQASGVSRPSSRAGDGDEFYALREYAPGDSLRTVAWKRSAFAEKLHVRQNAALLPDRLWIGVHAPAEVDEEQFERSLEAAAGLIDEATRREIEIGLLIPAANIRVPPRAGAAHRERLMDELALAVRSSAPPDPVHLQERLIVVTAGARAAAHWPAHTLYLNAPGVAEAAP